MRGSKSPGAYLCCSKGGLGLMFCFVSWQQVHGHVLVYTIEVWRSSEDLWQDGLACVEL